MVGEVGEAACWGFPEARGEVDGGEDADGLPLMLPSTLLRGERDGPAAASVACPPLLAASDAAVGSAILCAL